MLQVDAPSDSSSSAAAASSAPRLLLEPAGSDTPPLTIKQVLGKLRAYAQPGDAHAAAAAAASNGSTAAAAAAAAQQAFPYDLLQVVSSEELQAAGSGRFTRHVELQLPKGMTYTAGNAMSLYSLILK
jgi:sulfite reductase alpha subunit-like flavoprotein